MTKHMKNRIFLIGYMGCGKTTVGQALSQLTHSRLIDMDSEIEAIEQMAIKKMFMLFGEHEFRNKEAELLDKLCNITSAADVLTGGKGAIEKMMKQASKYAAFENLEENLIISCGGGIILDDLNRKILGDQQSVFLEGTPELLFERVKGDTNRPNAFMETEDEGERLKQFIERYEQREAYYKEAAAFTVRIDGKKPGEVAQEILSLKTDRCAIRFAPA